MQWDHHFPVLQTSSLNTLPQALSAGSPHFLCIVHVPQRLTLSKGECWPPHPRDPESSLIGHSCQCFSKLLAISRSLFQHGGTTCQGGRLTHDCNLCPSSGCQGSSCQHQPDPEAGVRKTTILGIQGKATLSDLKMISFFERDPPGHPTGPDPRRAGRGVLEEGNCLQRSQGSCFTEEEKKIGR